MGVAMVCGIVGVAVTSEDWTNNDSDSDLSSNGDGREDAGGSGGSGGRVPSGRSRVKVRYAPGEFMTPTLFIFYKHTHFWAKPLKEIETTTKRIQENAIFRKLMLGGS